MKGRSSLSINNPQTSNNTFANRRNTLNMKQNFEKPTNCLCCKDYISDDNYVYLPEFNVVYKIDHFNCVNCSESLLNGYYEKHEKYYCASCFNKKFLAKCEKCKLDINKEFKLINNLKFHPECLKCKKCDIILDGYEALEDKENFYCYTCSQRKYNNCFGCKESDINGKKVEIGDKKYHYNCLKCGVCKDNFEDEEEIYYIDSWGYHKDCFDLKIRKSCLACGYKIEGRIFEHNGDYCHFDCKNEFKKIKSLA